MAIKMFRFEVQADLRQALGIDLKRYPSREMIAALIG